MLKKVIVLSCLMFIISCNNKREITKISLNEFNGGKLGVYSKLEITKDDIYYVSGNLKSKKEVKEKTTKELWNNLIMVNIDDFLKVKSKPGRIAYDGTDVKISISYGEKSFSIINGEIDTLNYKKIKFFVSALENQKSLMYQQ